MLKRSVLSAGRCAPTLVALAILLAATETLAQPGSELPFPTGGFPAVQPPQYPPASPLPSLQDPGWEQLPPALNPGSNNFRPLFEQERGQLIVDVRIVGNQAVPLDEILARLRTRKDREFDPEIVQADKGRLTNSGLFRDVRVYTQSVRQGIVVTFEVFERPTIRYIKFIGNRNISDKVLTRESGLKVGEALNLYTIEEARRSIEEYYHRKGFPKATVFTREGNEPRHQGAVFDISEGPLQRIVATEFIGNTIATDQRLKTQIQSKPDFIPFMALFRGKVDRAKIDEDVERLTAYYRGLGYFRARVDRELIFDDNQRWLRLRFVIDEGPRYVIRNVSVIGNERFDSESLQAQLELRSGAYFNLAQMNRDVNTLRDVYGGQGHVFADVQADPRFLDEGSELDLVYNVTEGQQFRVGRINVHVAGEFPHTRESVVLDRLSIRPGDIVDVREVRASERRLKASQLFENDPSSGKSPRIVIRPPDFDDAAEIATGGPGRPAVRGQSPDQDPGGPPVLDLDIFVTPTKEPGR